MRCSPTGNAGIIHVIRHDIILVFFSIVTNRVYEMEQNEKELCIVTTFPLDDRFYRPAHNTSCFEYGEDCRMLQLSLHQIDLAVWFDGR